ncbi:GD23846 [Drosophila simulans]|uniref:GD23846 n=1 Tax=Drosophila simulans TaxID=7240 RepID=B4Q479_DROSI|nr:GD23846 [Drosophila simulans]
MRPEIAEIQDLVGIANGSGSGSSPGAEGGGGSGFEMGRLDMPLPKEARRRDWSGGSEDMSMSPPTDARRERRPRRYDFQVQGGIAGSHNAKRSSRGNYHELELQLPGW